MSSINASSGTLPAKQIASVTTLAILGIAYFLIVVIVLHFLRPDLNPISRFISEYAVGPYGFLMRSAFFGLSLGSLALVVGLYLGVSRPGRSWIGLVLLGVWGVGILIAGIFPADLQGAPVTTVGSIHQTASALAFLSVILATILISWRFKQDKKWSSFRRSALILSLVILVTFIGFSLSVNTEFGGLSQRIFIASILLWLLLTAARLRYVATGSFSKYP
jgi:hypothetical protein